MTLKMTTAQVVETSVTVTTVLFITTLTRTITLDKLLENVSYSAMSVVADVETTGEKELVSSHWTDSTLSCVSDTSRNSQQNLLATEAVDWYHSLRLYLQVEQ